MKSKRSILGSSGSDKSKVTKSKLRSRSTTFLDHHKDGFNPVDASVRKAVHLDEIQKESLLGMGTTGENTT